MKIFNLYGDEWDEPRERTPGSASSAGARARTWARSSRLEPIGFGGCGLDAAGQAAQDEPRRQLAGSGAAAAAPAAAVEQPPERQPA